MLSELSSDQRWAGFFCCWARKEAYVKAAGGGLSIRLDSFDVSAAPTETQVQVRVLAERGRSQRWSIETLEIEPGYAAAVAYEGAPAKTGLFECRPDMIHG